MATGEKGSEQRKSVVVQRNPQPLAQVDGALVGFHPHREDHHVEELLADVALLVGVLQQQIAGVGHRVDGVNPGADETDPVVLAGLVVIFLVILAERPDVHEEDGGVERLTAVLLGHHRFLDGIHAADRGAVAVVAAVQFP